eukprot:GDKI01034556.1.p2 GENE.GDKI01034556.1~~GDKI01034556.1.p2  ORF type:complete len:165 (-),score=41.09 GDKI01034556.1:22-516(-)
MGNANCCSLEPSKDKSVMQAGGNGDTRSVNDGSASPTSTNKVDEVLSPAGARYMQQMETGVKVTVLLQDGTSLLCNLSLNKDAKTLSVNFQEKVRLIPIRDIRGLLSGAEQLKRVETKAMLATDERCVAVHLEESGNCIPLKFSTADDKTYFIEVVKHIKRQDQ